VADSAIDKGGPIRRVRRCRGGPLEAQQEPNSFDLARPDSRNVTMDERGGEANGDPRLEDAPEVTNRMLFAIATGLTSFRYAGIL
jgi:hypothetical protein